MTSMEGPFPYETAAAFRAALRDRLAGLAREGGHGVDELQRQFAYDRLLARAFSGPDAERWVLKGAGALLARLPDARHSRDIDLAYSMEPSLGAREHDGLQEAEEAFRTVTGRDIEDHFRFEITRVSPLREAARGTRLHVVAFLGGRYAAFHVDVVIGTAMSAVPEISPPLTDLSVDGLTRPSYRLFPLVDHVADKMCAITEVHPREGGLQPSTRIKDLVDLALIANTLTVSSAGLRQALVIGFAHRGLPLPQRFAVPDATVWRAGYPARAREAAGSVPGFDDAVAMVTTFIDPVLADLVAGRWNPEVQAWE